VLEYVPACFKVIQHVRPKLSCGQCERIVQAPAPSRPIARGLAGPGLLAHVLISKYCDHQPLYRQSEIYARQGVDLERSTLADWVGGTSEMLGPLVEALRRYVMAGSKLHADDTPVPVLAPGNGRTKTGRLWTYVRDDRPAGDTAAPAVWFAYSPDRKGEHPKQHLRTFRGALQADAYAGFKHFIPRLFELLAQTSGPGNDFVDATSVFAKLTYDSWCSCSWRTWPESEQRALSNYFLAVWDAALDSDPEDLSFNGAYGWLAAIAQAEHDLTRYFDRWFVASSVNAHRNLALMITQEGLPRTKNVDGGYWAEHREQWEQLNDWLRRPEVRQKLADAFERWVDSPFAGQLMDAAILLP
jgi:transposase